MPSAQTHQLCYRDLTTQFPPPVLTVRRPWRQCPCFWRSWERVIWRQSVGISSMGEIQMSESDLVSSHDLAVNREQIKHSLIVRARSRHVGSKHQLCRRVGWNVVVWLFVFHYIFQWCTACCLSVCAKKVFGCKGNKRSWFLLLRRSFEVEG